MAFSRNALHHTVVFKHLETDNVVKSRVFLLNGLPLPELLTLANFCSQIFSSVLE